MIFLISTQLTSVIEQQTKELPNNFTDYFIIEVPSEHSYSLVPFSGEEEAFINIFKDNECIGTLKYFNGELVVQLPNGELLPAQDFLANEQGTLVLPDDVVTFTVEPQSEVYVNQQVKVKASKRAELYVYYEYNLAATKQASELTFAPKKAGRYKISSSTYCVPVQINVLDSVVELL
ncbi:MAG: hypothetical protein ACP5PP_09010 [Fervidobacterium sp.]